MAGLQKTDTDKGKDKGMGTGKEDREGILEAADEVDIPLEEVEEVGEKHHQWEGEGMGMEHTEGILEVADMGTGEADI